MLTSRFTHNTSTICSFSLLTLGALFFTSCTTTTAGKIADGRYTAPDDLFTMPVPALSLGLVIEDDFARSLDGSLRAGSVSFHDDFGHLRAVVYEEVPEASAEMRSEGALRDHFNDAYLIRLREGWPGVIVHHQGPQELNDGTAGWFAVLEIPGGSPMAVFDAEHPEGRRMDSIRAFLVLFHGDLFLTLSAANDSVLGGIVEEPAAGPGIDALKQTVADIYASMRFD